MEQTDIPKGLWSDSITVFSPTVRIGNSPSLQYNGEEDSIKDYNPATNPLWEKATTEQKQAMLFSRGPKEQAIKLMRYNAAHDAQKRLEDVPAYISIPTAIGASIVDPLTVPSLLLTGGFGHLLKGAHVATKVASLAAVGAAEGALLGSIDKSSGFFPETDIGLYSLIGLGLGGGGGVIEHLLSNAANPPKLAAAIIGEPTVPPATTTEITTKGKKGKKGKNKEESLVDPLTSATIAPKVESKAQRFMPDFFLSASQRLMDSDSNFARKIAQRMANSVIAGKVDNIPTPMNNGLRTGQDLKLSLEAKQNKVNKALNSTYAEARENGFKGSLASFTQAVQSASYKALSHQMQHKTAPKVFDSNPGINNMVKAQFEYFKEMAIVGKNINVYGVKNVNPNELYNPQLWDFDEIERLDISEVTNILFNSMDSAEKKLPINKRIQDLVDETGAVVKTSGEILMEAAMRSAESFKQMAFTRETMDASLIVPKEIPLGTHTKSRVLTVDPEVAAPLLSKNIIDTVGQYHYKQSGQYALNYSFPELAGKNTKEFMEGLQDIMSKGISEGKMSVDDLDNINKVIEELVGTYRIPKNQKHPLWAISKVARSVNSLVHGGSFVLNTAGELGVILLSKPISSLIATKFSAVMDVQKALFTKDKQVRSKVAQQLENMGLLMDINHVNAMSRHADVGDTFNVSKFEGVLNEMNTGLYKWTGMRGVTGALEMVNGVSAVDTIVSLGKKTKLNDGELMTLARLGLTPDEAKTIASMRTTIKGSRDNLYSFDLGKLPPKLVDKIQTAVQREVSMSVPKPNSMYAPDLIAKRTDAADALKLMALQFLSYPLTANQTIFMRGLSEDKVGMLVGSTLSLAMMASVMYLREQAAISIGAKEEADAKYGFEGAKLDNLIFESFGKNSLAGLIPTSLDYAAAISGQEGITSSRGYTADSPWDTFLGPTIGKVDPVFKTIQNVLSGEPLGPSDAYTLKSLTPFTGLPLWSEYLSHEIKY